MKVEKRLTKKQIKEDRLVSTTFKATEYIQKNKTPFMVGVAAVAAVFLLIIFVKWSGDRKTAESVSVLSRAELAGGTGSMDQYLADLKLLADDYSGSNAGKIATLRLANYFFDSRDYANAQVYYGKILDRYSDDKLITAGASAGIGAIHEIQGNYLEAAKAYKRAAEYKSGDIWTPIYLLRAGQNYAKAGDKKEAEAALERIEKEYTASSEIMAARRALAELKY